MIKVKTSYLKEQKTNRSLDLASRRTKVVACSFTNQGNTTVWINDIRRIEPGESYSYPIPEGYYSGDPIAIKIENTVALNPLTGNPVSLLSASRSLIIELTEIQE